MLGQGPTYCFNFDLYSFPHKSLYFFCHGLYIPCQANHKPHVSYENYDSFNLLQQTSGFMGAR